LSKIISNVKLLEGRDWSEKMAMDWSYSEERA
jgi:hypothetical protein